MSSDTSSTDPGAEGTIAEEVQTEETVTPSVEPEKPDWGDRLKAFAVIASGVGAAVGAAMLIEHFTDDTDAREYTPSGLRLTAEILAAYTALEGFFQGDETIDAARRWTTPERLAANRELLLQEWQNYSAEVSAGFEAMPSTWAAIQRYWADFTEEERQSIRDWSPID